MHIVGRYVRGYNGIVTRAALRSRGVVKVLPQPAAIMLVNRLRQVAGRIVFRRIFGYLAAGGGSHSFKRFTISAVIWEAVFLTVFSVASFPMTNLAAAT